MCCAVRHLPVTGFSSDHPFSMSDRSSTSPQPEKDETLALRVLPSRDIIMQGTESSQDLASRPNGSYGPEQLDPTQRNSLSPEFRHQRPESSSPSADHMRPTTSRSNSFNEQGQREQSYSASSVAAQDSVPAGQTCR